MIRIELKSQRAWLVPALLIAAGLAFRIDEALSRPLWVDEAESAINGLAIIEHGAPVGEFLGKPVFENVMFAPWPEHPEYQFRDVSYSDNGLAVYHGWLPLYAIALTEKIFGLDELPAATANGTARFKMDSATWAPRIPALISSVFFLLFMYWGACEMASRAAGLAALSFAALSSQCISFGSQARYYSLALALTAAGVLMLWRCIQRDRLLDYVLLGAVAMLLFHTHKICCLALLATSGSVLCLSGSRFRSVLPRALAAAAVFLVGVVPWMIATNFLSAGSSLPFALQDLEFPGDAFIYILQRPLLTVLLAVGLVAIVTPGVFNERALKLSSGGASTQAALVLAGWSFLSYVIFFVFMPSASFWFTRLTMVLAAPVILLFGMGIDAIAAVLSVKRRQEFALICVVLFLGVTDRLGARGSSSTVSFDELNRGVALLSRCRLPDARIYGTPPEHLVWSYYLREPIVSIAAVRPDFLERYRGQIILLDRAELLLNPLDRVAVRSALSKAGVAASEHEVDRRIYDVGLVAVRRRRAGEVAQANLSRDLPAYLEPFVVEVDQFITDPYPLPGFRLENPAMMRFMPVTHREWWQTFFLKYVNPDAKNEIAGGYSRRIQQATLLAPDDSSLLVYVAPPLCAESAEEECPSGCIP